MMANLKTLLLKTHNKLTEQKYKIIIS